MSRIRIAITAGVGAIATTAAIVTSSASAAKSHSVTLKTKEAAIYVTPGPSPGPPSFVTETGVFTGTLGTGVTRSDVHLLAGKGKFEFFNRRGSFRGSGVFTITLVPGGNTITATITITAGTGTYAHAHGTLHATGFHNDKTGYTTTTQTGSLTY